MDSAITQPQTTTVKVAPEFGTWPLDEKTIPVVNDVRMEFDKLLKFVETKIPGGNARYLSIVKTKLEEACQFAVKGIAKPVS